MALGKPKCHTGLSALMGIIIPAAWPGTPWTLEMDTWILGAPWDPQISLGDPMDHRGAPKICPQRSNTPCNEAKSPQ